MKKDEINMEERLLSSASLDELIKMKMEAELAEEFSKSAKKSQPKVITALSDVPQHLVFSKQAVYKLYNRKTHMETFINGVQAEALIGIQNNIREKMKNGLMDAFSTEDAYVKFEKITL